MEKQPTESPRTVIGAYEAKTHFASLLERVERGEELTITRNGLEIVRMVPARMRSSLAERQEAIDSIRSQSTENRLRGVTIASLIAQGRR
jgi:prevent-host-death family protein